MQSLIHRLGSSAIAGPALTGGAGLLALIFIESGSKTSLVVDQDALGPLSWPRVMIVGIIVASLLWGLARLRRNPDEDPLTPVPVDAVRLWIGIVTVVGYGTAIVYIGFAFATLLFMICWLWIGGMRRPLPIIANSLLGTLAVLYLFLKVAYLPLPRGAGWIDTLTVGLYQWLGIF